MPAVDLSADDFATSPWLYPGTVATGDGLLTGGELLPLEESHPALADDRSLVVAVGSNASPAVVHRKLARAGASTTVPFVRVTGTGLGIGHSAHVSARGYVPAAPFLDPAGAPTTLVALLLEDSQLRAIDETEPNYERVRPAGVMIALESSAQPGGVFVYASRWGLVLGEGDRPLGLTTQTHVFAHLRARSPAFGRFAADDPTETVMQRLAADPRHRAELGQALADEGLIVDAGWDGDVRKLVRWEDSGGVWRVVEVAGDRMTIALVTCDGGQEMERLTSTDPRLIAFVGDRRSSEA